MSEATSRAATQNSTSAEDPEPCLQKICSRVRGLVGGGAAIVFRSARQVKMLVRAQPFAAYESESGLKLYSVCFTGKPRGFYGFPNIFVQTIAGVQATSRNWDTIATIAKLMEPPRT